MNRTPFPAPLSAVGVVLLLAVAGCSAAPANGPVQALSEAKAVLPVAAVPAQPGAAQAAPATTCTPAAQASFPPSSTTAFPSGSLQQQIRARGFLVVGVSGDTRLLGARNFLQGGVLEGFDIDLARTVATAIFGDAGPSRIHWKVITAGQRFSQVNDGFEKDGVDLVARAVSMTCDRWTTTDTSKGASFSAGYFKSEQRLLVRSDLAATKGVTNLAALVKAGGGKADVCAPVGSTSLSNVQKVSGVTAVGVPIHSDCMALWQEGKVDAITGDDAILAGFKAQDRRATVVGPSMDTTYYAFAIGRRHPEFVQFVNAVLASQAGHTAWTKAYAGWLEPALPDQLQEQPAPDYTRPVP